MDLLRDTPEWKIFKEKDVRDVDVIIQRSRGRGTVINYASEKDWEIIRIMVGIVNRKYPGEIARYVTANRELVETRARDTGASESMNTRFLMQVPQMLLSLIKRTYPEQKLDRKFFREFAKRFGEFRVARKI